MFATHVQNLFIPSVKACRRPHAFTHKWLKFYSLALLSHVLLSVSFYSGPSFVAENPLTMAKNIITITNIERTNNELGELKENELLTKAAQAKLDDMFAHNYWDHYSPQNKKPWDFISEAQYSYVYAGENLAKGYIDSDSTVKAWLKSPTHKDNLLSSRYQEIGVAVGTGKINGKPTTLVVQMFGAPAGNAKVAAAENSIVLGVKDSNRLSFNSLNATIIERLPYFIIWLIMFGLIVFDGAMLRRCGLHHSKKHLFEFRSALLINGLVLIFLTANVVAIA